MSVLLILSSTLLAIFCYLALTFKLKRRHLEKLAAKIPGKPSYPIIGHGYLFTRIKSIQDMWEAFQSLTKGQDKIQKLWLGPKLLLVVTDPEYIEAILSNPAASEKDADIYRHLNALSSGVFTQNGKTWQSMRKPLNKLLQPKLVEGWQDSYCTHAEVLNDILATKIGKGVFDIYYELMYCTLDMICHTHGGVADLHEQRHTKFGMPKHMSELLNIAFLRAVKPQYFFDFIFNLTPTGKIDMQLKEALHATATELVKRRLNLRKEAQGDYSENKKYEYYTDVIIDLCKERNMDVKQMANWVTDFVIAGFDTTGVAMSCVITFLAMYPEYQEKVYQEQLRIFGDSTRNPTNEDLKEMAYLTQVYYETLRHVGIPAIVRYLGGDVKLDKYILPKGSSAYLMFYKMHKDPRYWKNFDSFYPNHFLPEEIAMRPKGVFQPFSKGPRGCPGQFYSVFSAKTVLSMVLRRFKFTTPLTPETMKFKYALMLEIAGGHLVEIFERN